MDSNSDVKGEICIVDYIICKSELKVSGTSYQPFSPLSYRPELDVIPIYSQEQYTVFQNMIVMVRWMIELRRIDFNLEDTLFSVFLLDPIIGHLY